MGSFHLLSRMPARVPRISARLATDSPLAVMSACRCRRAWCKPHHKRTKGRHQLCCPAVTTVHSCLLLLHATLLSRTTDTPHAPCGQGGALGMTALQQVPPPSPGPLYGINWAKPATSDTSICILGVQGSLLCQHHPPGCSEAQRCGRWVRVCCWPPLLPGSWPGWRSRPAAGRREGP